MCDDYMSAAAPVFNIQTYSIHDGPGIRDTVFVKGCPLKCLWCANPESRDAAPQLMTYVSRCTGCGKCVDKCPHGAIRIDKAKNAASVSTDRTRCTDCGDCTEACPNKAREIIGRLMTVRDVLITVLKDRIFYEASGGGVTISGGECLAYPEFSEALLYSLRREGLHTVVESCCFAGREAVGRVFRFVDLGLLDIKHMNSTAHRKFTGVPNEQILENIKFVYHDMHVPVIIRIPVIPGYNDSERNIADTASFAAEQLGFDVQIHLMPYHRLGESKNESLGKSPEFSIAVPSDEQMQKLKEISESFGIKTQVGG